MPDFFDRLIARGTRQPGGGTPAPGQPGRRAGVPGSGAPVAFALPRLPGPFERPVAGRPGPFLEAIDEVREADTARPQTPRAWPAPGGMAGTQTATTPAQVLRDATAPRAPRPATSSHGEEPSAGPALTQQAPLLPTPTQVHLVTEARAAAPDQASAGASPVGEAWRGGEPLHAEGPRGVGPREVAERVLAVPASAVRAAPPAADETRTAAAPAPAPPPVVVRIGRIEVRNTSQDRRERQPKRASRPAPKQSLAAYLAAASGGQNSSGVSTGGAR